jgi:lauroyl/myristoyl acyltransferase
MKRDLSMKRRHPAAKLMLNMMLNAMLAPLYLGLFALTTLLAASHIFPARVARKNLHTQKKAGLFLAVFGTSAVLMHYVLLFIENVIFWPLGALIVRHNQPVRDDVAEASRLAAQEKRGLAILSAHFGNIEVSADGLALTVTHHINAENRVIALAKPSKSAWATRFLAWYRHKRGIEIIQTSRKDLVRAMMQGFKQQKAIALLVDQKPSHAGHFIDFFGSPAAFPEGGIEIALRSRAEMICFSSRRIWPGLYTYEGRWLRNEIHAPEPTHSVLQAYSEWLEGIIHKSPWQWCWDYKKWSRVPPRETSVQEC